MEQKKKKKEEKKRNASSGLLISVLYLFSYTYSTQLRSPEQVFSFAFYVAIK